MQTLSQEFYETAVKTVFPDAENFKTPTITGKNAHVVMFQTQTGPRVCRFNNRAIIVRNHKITNLLYNYGVAVKPTQQHAYLGQFFESYEYDPHLTLSEKIKKMSVPEINDAYKSALCIQAQLASLPVSDFSKISNARFMDVYNLTVPNYVKNDFMQTIYRKFYQHFSSRGNIYIIHNDLTPANMLVSDDCRSIVRLIDFDGISICNENIALFGMLRRYPLDNINDFLEYYQDVSGHTVNRREIISMLKLFKSTLKLRCYANTLRFNQH